VRTLSSLQHRKVVTESGRSLGRVYDLRGELADGSLEVIGLVAGRRGFFEHLGVVERLKCIPWDAVVRIEGKRIVVRDPWA
jgi:sporulation protein YlmC with PRC-barrel domain